MWSDEEINHILDIFPEALNSDVLIPRPTDRPSIRHTPSKNANRDSEKTKEANSTSLVDPIWENLDPTPDIRALFLQFNTSYFDGKLSAVEVRWSPRMTLCAGLCCYEGRGGLCSIRLSEPLLKLRPRSDLVETLLHEMIHAFLFVTQRDRDRESHGPNFRHHMKRINSLAGTNITVFHTFHREVENYQTHWWRCTGTCRDRPPFYGYVKRSMNRAPGPNDTWWSQHQATCQGHFVKIREPTKAVTSGQSSKQLSSSTKRKKLDTKGTEKSDVDIRAYLQYPCPSTSSSSVVSKSRDLPPVTESSAPVDQTSASAESYAWPETGHVLGGACKPKQSRLLALNVPPPRPTATNDNHENANPPPEPSVGIVAPELAPCPVCTELVPMLTINDHLDLCLS